MPKKVWEDFSCCHEGLSSQESSCPVGAEEGVGASVGDNVVGDAVEPVVGLLVGAFVGALHNPQSTGHSFLNALDFPEV
jgi:hypothetical protein